MMQNRNDLGRSSHESKTKQKTDKKMIVVILISAFLISIFIWNKLSEEVTLSNFNIPESNNITYDVNIVKSVTPSDIMNEIESIDGKPIMLHLYATWCSICKKQLPEINELSRIFQNTDLKFIIVAIDKNITTEDLTNYLNYYGNIYFEAKHLAYSEGLSELLKQKSISYNRKIPFTVLISENGKVSASFNGYKSKNYLQKKIIKLLGKQK